MDPRYESDIVELDEAYRYNFDLLRIRKSHTDKRADNNVGITLTRTEKLNVTRSSYHDSTNSTTAARVKNSRIAQNMTIKELAQKTNLTPEAIGRIENNKSTPTITTLRRISKVLSESISYLGCFENLPEDTLGQKIKKARLCLGLTKFELSKLLNIDVKTLRSMERDTYSSNSKKLDTLFNYLKILDSSSNKSNLEIMK